MSLRDENPLADADLELIITAFEKSMVKSRDIDSVFVPFRREISAFANYPKSIVEAIDNVPTESTGENNDSVLGIDTVAVTFSPETLTDGDEEAEDAWADKVKGWVSECVPCSGSLTRPTSSLDTDFFKDINFEWDRALKETWDKLIDFDDLLTDTDISGAFCDLGLALKGQCVPDIKKMMFILNMMLTRMETEVSLDLSITDSFLMAALSPIFNGLAANLDLISTLALDPIKCVLDYMQYQINNRNQIAGEARAAIIDPIRDQARSQRDRINTALRQNHEVLHSGGMPSSASEAELAADRARLEEQRRLSNIRGNEQMVSARQRANQAFNKTRDSINYLDTFQEYLTTGTDYLTEKKDWLLSLIEEFVNSGLDRWDDKTSFANTKTDLLTMASILGAIIDAAQAGDLACGPDSDGMTEEDVTRIVRYWQHPSESLEIIVENGSIVTRRRPDIPSTEEAGDRGIITGSNGPDSTGTGLSNIVVRRPISSCLKKITTDEADQVQNWIRQLEQEV